MGVVISGIGPFCQENRDELVDLCDVSSPPFSATIPTYVPGVVVLCTTVMDDMTLTVFLHNLIVRFCE